MHQKQFDSTFFLNDVAIDPLTNLATRDGKELEIPPKVLKILQYLAGTDGKLVTYQDLADNVWNGFVSESALYQQMTQLRKVLGDKPNNPQFVKTIPRRGYRLIAQVHVNQEQIPEPHQNSAQQSVQQPKETLSEDLPEDKSSNIDNNRPLPAHVKRNQFVWLVLSISTLALLSLMYLWKTLANTGPHSTLSQSHIPVKVQAIAFEVDTPETDFHHTELLDAIVQLSKKHLNQKQGQYVLETPVGQKFVSTGAHREPIAFVFKTHAEHIDGHTLIGMKIYDASGKNIVSSIKMRIHDQAHPQGVLDFEKKFLTTLSRLNLLPSQYGQDFS